MKKSAKAPGRSLTGDGNLKNWRLLVQSSFALFYLFAGYRFYLFYQWTLGYRQEYIPRPPSIEAFLPIGALVGLKRLLLSGEFDQVHPAGLTIFLAAIFIAVFLRKGFCGWLCPVGFTSNLIERLGKKLKFTRRLPDLFDYPMMGLKYLLLAFFAFLIFIKMDLRAIRGFNESPYNLVVDAKMLLFFLEPGIITLWVLGLLFLISLVLRNFWCRYLCPYGALLGLLAMFGPARVERDRESCVNCRKCEKACPASIRVAEEVQVESPECIGCLECLAACPVDDCLKLKIYSGRRLSSWVLPVAVVGVILGFWLIALSTGHWQQSLDPALLKKYYRMGADLTHP